MPPATDETDSMSTDVIAPVSDDHGDSGGDNGDSPQKPNRSLARPGQVGGGFFHIYKYGQGYWTRMGTVGGAALIGILTANFIYTDLPPRIEYLSSRKGLALGIAAAFLAAYALLVFWYMNRPTSGDFLISTDSEMKKVNWTSRKELIGSTKVVIIFMFLIAFLLFAIDIIFGYLFYFAHILKNPPF